MSDLVYQNYNNRCQGWVNPGSLAYPPIINSLSGYKSPAGATTVISVTGTNFFSYSTISFGTYSPTVYFVNSFTLKFYVPATLNAGTFPVQVFNGSTGSNIIMYTIDNASGYWLLNGNGSIVNTNAGLCVINELSRNAPYTISDSTLYVIPDNLNWVICNNINGDVNVELPTNTEYTGREIMFKNTGTGRVLNSTTNIVNSSGSTSNQILNNTNSCATLVYDGALWVTMQWNIEQKIYTMQYTSSTTINLSAISNLFGISVRLIGRGGNAGKSDETNIGHYSCGGTGGGASTVISNSILPLVSETIYLTINNDDNNGYVEIITNNVTLCKAFGGYKGENASHGVPGIGGLAQTNGTGNANYGNWSIIAGNAGQVGNNNSTPTTISSTSYISSPLYKTYSDDGLGCGQRFNSDGIVTNQPESSPSPQSGICYITFYIQ